MSLPKTIVCPKCNTVINVDTFFDQELKAKEQELVAQLEAKAKLLDEQNAKQSEETRKKAFAWAQEEIKKSEEAKNKEIDTLQKEGLLLKQQKEQAEKIELEARKKAAALEEREKGLELEIARKMDDEKKKMQEVFEKQQQAQVLEQMEKLGQEYTKKLSEKDKQMEMLKTSIDDMKRKSEQGSQQIQWEIQEEALKETLSKTFYHDRIEDVPTGIRGADLVQTVCDQFGKKAGIILWESKNTKSWSGDWINKLKNDALKVNAEICVLVSNVLPEDIKYFGLHEGVWVTDALHYLPLTYALRGELLSLARLNSSLAHKEEKMEVLYSYLSSNEFRAKFESIVRAFAQMKDDLESEKRAMYKHWQRREKELERVIQSSSSLYGDLEGIMGRQLQTIELLSLERADERDEPTQNDKI